MPPANAHPSSPIATFDASQATGMDSAKRALERRKAAERAFQRKCTHCGKTHSIPLSGCSRCKAARYCDETCQRADYKARHKRECAHFAHPPMTVAFLTQPVAEERYASQPAFAHRHRDGVGCWVGIGGDIRCDLQYLVDAMDPLETAERRERLERSGPHVTDIFRVHRAGKRTMLPLRVLVQNRRKDNARVLVFGARAQVVSYPYALDKLMPGLAENDNFEIFTYNQEDFLAIGVAYDPFEHRPRVLVTHINGTTVDQDALPDSVKDAKQGIVSLGPGDHAIMALQFRVWNGANISFKDFQALVCLESIFVPYAVWDGTTHPASLAASLPRASYPARAIMLSRGGRGTDNALQAAFDQDAARAHYADYLERGQDAYLRSHYSDARADAVNESRQMADMLDEMMLAEIKQAGMMDEYLRHLRASGMDELADQIAGEYC
ncbi:hypothetical protein C8Q79DRAFT_494910 [Trametes meyenii]|nr:hypothetical protein C8Q79DRAFT_494910 [Trametes meyenii]